MKTITISDGNLPSNISIFDIGGVKKLNIDGEFFDIPDDEEMAQAVQKRFFEDEIEKEAVEIMNFEMKVGRLDVFSREYDSENASRMRREFGFRNKYGIEAMDVYKKNQKRNL